MKCCMSFDGLSNRANQALGLDGIFSLADLERVTLKRLVSMRNVGEATVAEIAEYARKKMLR